MTRSSVRPFLVMSAIMGLAALTSCKQNRAPNVPSVPAGPEYCYMGMTYTFKTTATDPDGDSVEVRFDWGDSTVSFWEGWFASGDTIALTHAWSDTGTYEVRATAQDLTHHTSGPSGELTVRVALRWPPNAPAEPSGPDTGGKDSSFTFTATAIHPGDITVAIRFAWGDGDTSGWSSFVASGESVALSHAWAVPDTYAVTAQAKDTGNALSLWSVPHSIIVRPLDTLRKWRFQLSTVYGFSLLSSPAIAPDGTIYVGSPDSALYAVNPDGTLRWRRPTGVNVRSSPAIAADGTIYIGSYDGHLYAINPDSTLKWSYWLPPRYPVSSPAIATDGAIYCACYIDLYALSPDGTTRRSFTTGTTTNAAAAIAADGTIYVATQFDEVYALYPDFSRKWVFYSKSNDLTDPAIASDGTIYFGSEHTRDANFFAVYPEGIFSKWRYSAGLDVQSAPVVAADGTIYFGSTDNYLYALSPEGALKWRYQTGGDVDAGPAVAADGTVYVGSDDNCLYAVNADGTLKWRYETGGHVEAAPTIGTDGTVYFCSDDGYLYALRGTSPLADSPWPKFHHDLRNTGCVGGGSWSRLDVVDEPVVAPDSSGFLIRIANAGNTAVTIGSLEYSWASGAAFMRDFLVDGARGYGYPIPNGQPGTGPSDTLLFASVTVQPYGSQQVELQFLDFHVDSLGADTTTNVVGKEFRFRFEDGSEIVVHPR